MSDYCQDCVHNEVCRYDAYCPTGHCNDKDTVDDLRPQGEWIGNHFDEHHCFLCGHYALYEEEPDGYYEVQSNFCPNCGADMRGGRG